MHEPAVPCCSLPAQLAAAAATVVLQRCHHVVVSKLEMLLLAMFGCGWMLPTLAGCLEM